jgi:hypothetical protein
MPDFDSSAKSGKVITCTTPNNKSMYEKFLTVFFPVIF